MGFDLVDEGGGGGRVGAEIIEDGVYFAPEVAIGALLEGRALGGGVREVALDDVACVDPEDTHKLSRTELEEGEETEGFGPRDRLATRNSPLNDNGGGRVGRSNAKQTHAYLLERAIDIFGAS